MKVKLQFSSKLRLVKAVMGVLDLGLKEAKDLVDERGVEENDEFYIIVDSKKTEEQIRSVAIDCGVTYIPLSDAETVKITSSDVGLLLDAVMELCQLPLKEASSFVREHTVHEPTCVWICIDIDRPRKEIEVCANNIPGIEVQFLNDTDTAAPESANYHEAEQKLQKAKLQEVTYEDLGVSIHSIDEMSIGWQRKALFSYKQAARVMAGLRDAKFNVTEANVMYEGQKTTMLVVTKTFPTGTRKKDLEKFENLLHAFMYATCKVVDLEERIEGAKEFAIEAFNNLQDYE